jgi:hypothetical protein
MEESVAPNSTLVTENGATEVHLSVGVRLENGSLLNLTVY